MTSGNLRDAILSRPINEEHYYDCWSKAGGGNRIRMDNMIGAFLELRSGGAR